MKDLTYLTDVTHHSKIMSDVFLAIIFFLVCTDVATSHITQCACLICHRCFITETKVWDCAAFQHVSLFLRASLNVTVQGQEGQFLKPHIIIRLA